MLAREIMTTDPECVRAGDTIEHAAEVMRDISVGLVPVVDGADKPRLIGVVTDRDIVMRHVAEGHGNGCKVEEAMTRDGLVTASPDDDVDDVMRRMRKAQVRRVPIVEDGGLLLGIVSQADLALQAKDDREVERTVEAISRPARPQR